MKLLAAVLASLCLLGITLTVWNANTAPTRPTAQDTQERTRRPYTVVTPTTVPERRGLGITRSSVVSKFTEASLGFTFRERQILGDGNQRVLGLSRNNQVLIELIGPAHDLTEASASAEITGGARNATMNGLAMAGLLKHVFPDWTGSTDWLTGAMRRALSGGTTSSTSRNGVPVEFQYHESLGIAVVTINH